MYINCINTGFHYNIFLHITYFDPIRPFYHPLFRAISMLFLKQEKYFIDEIVELCSLLT
jgi:hypothetical protein